MSEDLKKVFLHDFHKNNFAKFVSFAGYSMPINYKEGIIKEHLHVRNSAGLFDVSHMGQILIPYNNENIEILLKYIPIDLRKINLYKSCYSFLLNKLGGIIDDIIVSKILYQNSEYFFIVYNAGRRKEDEKIFTNYLSKYILLKNNSLLAIQGPESEKVMVFLDFFKDFLFMNCKTIDYLSNEIIISRTGYTGEDGFEISIPNQIIKDFIFSILKNTNVKLCGLGSRDTLRLEAGLSLYGNELNENMTPIESNLIWAMHTNRLHDNKLNGSKKLQEQINSGVENVRIGFKPVSKFMLRSNMKVFDNNNEEIGLITSGGFSPILESSIGIGYLKKTKIELKKVFCLVREKIEELTLEKLPFINNNYKRGV